MSKIFQFEIFDLSPFSRRLEHSLLRKNIQCINKFWNEARNHSVLFFFIILLPITTSKLTFTNNRHKEIYWKSTENMLQILKKFEKV